jgi:hypothetical protein
VRDDEATLDIARYVLANPVRAGLVVEPRDYPFSGSLVFSRQQLDELWHEGTPERRALRRMWTPCTAFGTP